MEPLVVRRAIAADLPSIVELLADDPLGAHREDARLPLETSYEDAFQSIDADPHQLLVVAVDGDAVIGTLQLSFLRGISRKGALRGQIEAVRISRAKRGSGLGEQLVRWAINACALKGCELVQLTSDVTRTDAHRFYERLGFEASHVGFKLTLG